MLSPSTIPAPPSRSAGGVVNGVDCSPARSKISLLPLTVGVTRFVESARENTIMATTNPQVRRSNKSLVFLTPMILEAPDPPNWLDNPPPFTFYTVGGVLQGTTNYSGRFVIIQFISPFSRIRQ